MVSTGDNTLYILSFFLKRKRAIRGFGADCMIDEHGNIKIP